MRCYVQQPDPPPVPRQTGLLQPGKYRAQRCPFRKRPGFIYDGNGKVERDGGAEKSRHIINLDVAEQCASSDEAKSAGISYERLLLTLNGKAHVENGATDAAI